MRSLAATWTGAAYLGDFYSGGDGLEARLVEREAAIDPREASTVRLQDLTPRVRIGRYGPFLELEKNGDRLTASLPDDVAPADLSEEQAIDLLRKRAEGPDRLGEDPDSGEAIYLMEGRFGPYVQRGERADGQKPKRASLPKNMRPEDVSLATALKLLAMPAPLGAHPESGDSVKVGIGRYGPYVVHQSDYRSLTEGDDPLDITFERAMELLSAPKTRGRRASATPLREVGAHPDDGEPIAIYKGRYGPYVKHGKTNASLPRGMEPDEVTLDVALDLLKKRRERDATRKAGRRRGGSRKKSSRK